MADRRKERRALAATWTSLNPVLLDGEIGFEKDGNRFKFGNGTSAWNDLPYVGSAAPIIHTIECSDRFTPISAATNVASRIIPVAFALTEVQAAFVGTVPAAGTFTIDINLIGVTVLSTKLTIDAGEPSSITASVPAVISNSTMTRGGTITIDVDDDADGTGSGLIVTLIGN